MNKPTRVMLCDDSSVARRLLRSVLTEDPLLDVVYEAVNGQDAVDNLDSVQPDVVILDVEMPVMDGIVAARKIRRRFRTLPIIMFSSLTSEGAEATMDALAAGANDFAIKPAGAKSMQAVKDQVQQDLIGKIRTLVGLPSAVREKLGASGPERARSSSTQPQQGVTPATLPAIPATRTSRPVPAQKSESRTTGSMPSAVSPADNASVIAIGVSTGGPDALSKLLSELPKPFPAPILITQHMPPVFTGLLADRLSQHTGHHVREAKHGDAVAAGEILIAPGDFHLTVRRKGTKVLTELDQNPPENSCRPSVDPMFRSVAKVYGNEAIAVVLTGMGTDGGAGSQAIKGAGGRVFIQDEASSVVWGMPGHVARLGQADRVLPVEQIATELTRAVESKPQPVTV